MAESSRALRKRATTDASGSFRVNERNGIKDAYLGLHFFVEIDGINVATFSECSALTMETETFEYAEGGLNTYTHKLPVRTKYGNITLKRGLDPAGDLYTWYLQSMDGQNKGRRNVSITLYNSEHRMVRQWQLLEAFPVKWTGPDFKADAGAVTVETLEFAHSGLIFNNAQNVGL